MITCELSGTVEWLGWEDFGEERVLAVDGRLLRVRRETIAKCARFDEPAVGDTIRMTLASEDPVRVPFTVIGLEVESRESTAAA